MLAMTIHGQPRREEETIVIYLRKVDFAQLAATGDRAVQSLLDRDSGATTCAVNCIKTPPGEGSPAGMHTHAVDQLFYVLSGTMNLEIAGEPHVAGPGTLVVFPAGVPHRNWNGGAEPTIHLAVNVPLPEPGQP
ncbi:MAG TPA: cupin domain-containing protein, partial [Candidatus Dormibacteraeota bacterium]